MAKTQKVVITDDGFNPSSVTVGLGGSVQWKNEGSNVHKLVFDQPGPPDSSDLKSGATHTQPFLQSGTFPYHCEHHPEMTGEVVVA